MSNIQTTKISEDVEIQIVDKDGDGVPDIVMISLSAKLFRFRYILGTVATAITICMSI